MPPISKLSPYHIPAFLALARMVSYSCLPLTPIVIDTRPLIALLFPG
jgi:hypothetical protein